MKIRSGFVTNSSSSSYIVIYGIKDEQELRKYIINKFGEIGISIINDNIASIDKCGYDLDSSNYNSIIYSKELFYISEPGDEPIKEDDVSFIIRHMPKEDINKYFECIYEGEDC